MNFVCRVFIIFVFCFGISQAETCTRAANINENWLTYELDEFIFYYTLQGVDAVDNTDNDETPNIVMDMGKQLTAAREVLDIMSYQLPLDSPRYKSQSATKIAVVIKNLKGNGLAFDEVRKLPNGECALLININSKYKTGNLTPAHELFHLVQYGYTMFKAGWYLEGLARWSETILGRPMIKPTNIPYGKENLEQFWRTRYSAAGVWQALINNCDTSNPKVQIPDHLLSLRYSNGDKVVVDDFVAGHKYVLGFLINLSELDKSIGKQEGLTTYHWPESVQKDLRFSNQIWQAALNSCDG